MSTLTAAQWDSLVDAIKDQACIFFLGPGATINYGDSNRQSTFFEQLAKENLGAGIVAYHEADGFLVFNENESKGQFYAPLKKFYLEKRPNALLDQLAEIPFHVAISVTPDLALNDAFERKQYASTHEYYDPKSARKLNEPPSKDRPLIYNLLGCVNEPESLITSHFDLFDTVQSMVAYQYLPQQIVTLLSSGVVRSVVFLGFEFDKWYYQLVLYLLRLKGNPMGRIATKSGDQDDTQQKVLHAQFKINFIDDDLDGFVTTLHSKFDAKELGHAKLKGENSRKYLLKNAIKLVTEAFSPEELERECLASFTEVYRNWPNGMSQDLRIQMLIDHCDRQGKMDQLLAAAAEHNPFQYNECAPYYES